MQGCATGVLQPGLQQGQVAGRVVQRLQGRNKGLAQVAVHLLQTLQRCLPQAAAAQHEPGIHHWLEKTLVKFIVAAAM